MSQILVSMTLGGNKSPYHSHTVHLSRGLNKRLRLEIESYTAGRELGRVEMGPVADLSLARYPDGVKVGLLALVDREDRAELANDLALGAQEKLFGINDERFALAGAL